MGQVQYKVGVCHTTSLTTKTIFYILFSQTRQAIFMSVSFFFGIFFLFERKTEKAHDKREALKKRRALKIFSHCALIY
jgi:hypothetical protein